MSGWLKRLLRQDKQSGDQVLGISLAPERALWCLLQQSDAGQQVTQSFSLQQSFASPAAALKALLAAAPPPQAPLHICLGHQYYNLLLVDAPDVPDAELREAVRWKVKDLITQPVENMVLDAFRLPQDAYRGRMNMLYVAVAERDLIQRLVDECHRADLLLQEITINELALTALAGVIPELQEQGAAFLYLNGEGGTINLVEQGALYLTRTIELAAGTGVFSGNLDFQQDPVDNLALDVQRSLDYYESQVGKSGITRLYLVTDAPEQEAWCDELSGRLPIKAEPLAESALAMTADTDLSQGALAPALGAALGGWRE